MIYKYRDKKPEVAADTFLAPGCKIIGDVQLKERTNIWYNTVLRGDLAPIVVGRDSNIQDNCSLHVNYDQPLLIGESVTVGHGARVHGCKIGDNCLIGMGATILNGAVIGENCIIGANCLVPEDKVIEPGSLVLGLPGKVVRKLSEEEIANLSERARNYTRLAQEYREIQEEEKS